MTKLLLAVDDSASLRQIVALASQGEGATVLCGPLKPESKTAASRGGLPRCAVSRRANAAKAFQSLMGDSAAYADDGAKLVDQAFHRLSEINAISGEQVAGLGQFNSAITQLDEVAQQNIARFKQAAANARQDQARLPVHTERSFQLPDSAEGNRSARPSGHVASVTRLFIAKSASRTHFKANFEANTKAGVRPQGAVKIAAGSCSECKEF